MEMHSEGKVMTVRLGLVLWHGVCMLLAILVLASIAGAVTFNPTDYGVWALDWNVARNCLADSAFPCQQVSKFPLAYLFNSALLAQFPNRDQSILALLNLSVLLLPLLAGLAIFGREQRRGTSAPYLLALLLSPLPLFYIFSGALEVQSAVFSGIYLGLFVHMLSAPDLRIGRAAQLCLFVSGLAFPLYKDTLSALIGLVCLVLLAAHWKNLRSLATSREGRISLLRAAVLAALPVLLAMLLSMGYNFFRYGAVVPLAYVEEAKQTSPGLYKSVEFLFGSFFSPNGGVLIFWGAPAFLMLFGWRVQGWKPRREVLLAGVTLVAISALMFCRWWAPFGWDGWGNRLLLPSVLAALIAVFMGLRSSECKEAVPEAGTMPIVLACVPLLVCSAYYIAIPYVVTAGAAMHDSLWPGEKCERMQKALPDQAIAQGLAFWRGGVYYSCARERMLYVPAPK